MKHTIEIKGLTEGWEPVAYRDVYVGEDILTCKGVVKAKPEHIGAPWLVVKKKQPRRIVLEETDVDGDEFSTQEIASNGIKLKLISASKIWKEVNENDLSLTKQDDNESLRLSVDECKIIHKWLNTFDINFKKITEFIKGK